MGIVRALHQRRRGVFSKAMLEAGRVPFPLPCQCRAPRFEARNSLVWCRPRGYVLPRVGPQDIGVRLLAVREPTTGLETASLLSRVAVIPLSGGDVASTVWETP